MKKVLLPQGLDMHVLSYTISHVNSFVYLCRLLITFANSLDPDQARQNAGHDLDPNC